jgi:hypothetical protein
LSVFHDIRTARHFSRFWTGLQAELQLAIFTGVQSKIEKNRFDNETTAATRMRFHLGRKGPLSRICSGLVFAAVMVAIPVVPSLEMSKVF